MYLLPSSYTARKWFRLLGDCLLYDKSWLNFCFRFGCDLNSILSTALPRLIIFQFLYLLLASPWEYQVYVYANSVNAAQIELFCTRHHQTANEVTVLSCTTLKSHWNIKSVVFQLSFRHFKHRNRKVGVYFLCCATPDLARFAFLHRGETVFLSNTAAYGGDYETEFFCYIGNARIK